MKDLKAKWKDLVKELERLPQDEIKGADLIVAEGLTLITVKSNSRPNQQWVSELFEAASHFRFYLSDHGTP